ELRSHREGPGTSRTTRGVHARARLPERGDLPRAGRGLRGPLEHPAYHGGSQGAGEVRRPLEPLPAGLRARRGPLEPGVRASVRGHGPQPHGARGLQLQRPRHGQHGGPRPLREPGAAGTMAQAASGGRDPVGLLHDRARRGLLRRDQHPGQDRARRGRVRRERPQVVVHGRGQPAVQDLDPHGQDRPRGEAPRAAVHDPGPPGYPGRRDRAYPLRLRLRRGPARPRRDLLRRREGPGREHPVGRGQGLRHRPGAPRSRAHPPLHAPDRCGREGARAHVRAGQEPRGVRQAARRAGRDHGVDRRLQDGDRAGPSPHPEGRPHDGHGRQQGGPLRDRPDKGRRPKRDPEGARPRHPGLRRGGRLGGYTPGRLLGRVAHPAPRRRPGRGPPRIGGQTGAQKGAPRRHRTVLRPV
ncbi:MAG: Acyl-CoA dehydrogenase, partial [uncultured Rubrobacteraceae bacterium]